MLRGGDLVVVLVAGQAHFEHGRDHLATDIDGAVHRRDGEVTALGARAVAHIAAFILFGRIARQFDIVELVIARRIGVLEADVVEHEEFGFRADIDGVADAERLEIGLRTLRGRARVAGIKLAGRRLDDVADQDQHRGGAERIGPHRVQIGLPNPSMSRARSRR